MFNKLYEKSLKLAAHKRSKIFLAIISFAESSFFPIPPDVIIVPMVIAKKNDYLKVFLIATLFSALASNAPSSSVNTPLVISASIRSCVESA